MQFSPTLASLLVALVGTSSSYAQSSTDSQSQSSTSSSSQPSATVQPPSQLISDLQSGGFNGFASALNQLSGSAEANDLFSKIQNAGNESFLIFAPSDDAISNIPSSISQNTTLLADYISYHFVQGQFNATAPSTSNSNSARAAALFGRILVSRQDSGSGSSNGDVMPIAGIWPNVTIGRTLLNASYLVQLEGNRSQVLVWNRSGANGNITVLNQAENITVQSSTQYNQYLIAGINGTLIPPGNLTTALTAINATVAQNLLQSVQVPGTNGTNVTVIEALQSARGLTFFVPNNDAFTTAFNDSLPAPQNDSGKLTALLQNHYINGTTIYSTQIGNDSKAVTAAGEQIQFINNATGIFVQGSNGTSAQVVRPDVLLDNGVAHVINGVFFDTNSDPSAAVSAYSAASSAATVSTSAAGPITNIIGGGSAPTPAPTPSDSQSQSIVTVTTTSSA